MQTRAARWAPLVPASGIQGLEELIAPGGGLTIIQISNVIGLEAALAARPVRGAFAAVAFSGRYSDLVGAPALGSAAFADISAFQAAFTRRTLQIGVVALVAGQQSYTVTFTDTMNAVPKIELQHFMVDDNGEVFFCSVAKDSVTTTGFKFWLNGLPTVSSGEVQYRAFVQSQP